MSVHFGRNVRDVVVAHAFALWPAYVGLGRDALVGNTARVAQLLAAIPLTLELRIEVVKADWRAAREEGTKAVENLGVPVKLAYRKADEIKAEGKAIEAWLTDFNISLAKAMGEDEEIAQRRAAEKSGEVHQ